jgi:hypothetical protein
MRGLGILIALVVLGASLTHVSRRPANAADVADRMQSLVGQRNGQVAIRSILAEGDVLVITLDGPPGWRQALPSYAMTAYFVDRVCEDSKAAQYFEHGRVLRVDSTDTGAHPVHGAPMDHCPPPSTSAISR